MTLQTFKQLHRRSFTPPSSALCPPGCSDDVLYSVSVTNCFSSLMDEHDQSSVEGLSPFMGDHNQSSVKGVSPAVSNKGLENPSAASSRTLRKRRGRHSRQENHHSCIKDMGAVSTHDESHGGPVSITMSVCPDVRHDDSSFCSGSVSTSYDFHHAVSSIPRAECCDTPSHPHTVSSPTVDGESLLSSSLSSSATSLDVCETVVPPDSLKDLICFTFNN